MKSTRHNLLFPSAKQPFWGRVQTYTRPTSLEDAGYLLGANPDSGEHNYLFQVNSDWNTYIEQNARQLMPDVVVGNLAEARVTNDETDFVAASLAGYCVLFLDGNVFTAARTLTNFVHVGMDTPDSEIDLDTFDLTFAEVTGYLGLTTNTGKLILDGPTHNLIVRGSVTVEEGENFSGSYSLNGVWFSSNQDLQELLQIDHLVVLLANITNYPNTNNYVYWDVSTSVYKRRDGTTINPADGARVHFLALDTPTADVDLSVYDKQSYTQDLTFLLPNGTYDIILGDDCQFNLQVTNELKLTFGARCYGFVNGNARYLDEDTRLIINGLVCKYASDTTIDVDIASFKWKRFLLSLNATWDSAGGIGLNAWDDDGAELTTSKSEHFIWLLINKTTAVLATVGGYNKTAPLITNAAFDDYEVVTLLTHFAVDSSGDIVRFIKKGNVFNYQGTAGTQGILLLSSSAAVGTPGTADTALAVPLIDEIDSLNLAINPTANAYWVGLIDENLGSSEALIISGGGDAAGNQYAIVEYPLTQQLLYASNNSTAFTLYGFQCRYNNIQGD